MRTVTTQKEIDDAGSDWVKIESGSFVLRGNAHAVLRGNAHAVLWGNAHAVLWGNAHAVLRGNAHAELWENAHAELWENAHAELRGNAHAELWENAHAVLRGNAHAELWDFSIVHLMSQNCKIKKGNKATIIKPNYPSKIQDWAKIKGLTIKKGRIYLYKVLRLNGNDFYSDTINYLKEATAPDWKPNYKEECGCGLHLADSPEGARYFLSDRQNYQLIMVSAKLYDCKCFPGLPQYPMKLRAKTCRFEKLIEKVENGKLVV